MIDQKPPEELKALKIPDILPIIPIFNSVVFPTMTFPLEIGGVQSVTLVDEVMSKDRLVGLVTSKKAPQEATPEDL
jgi:ATP-dependent Lon protease